MRFVYDKCIDGIDFRLQEQPEKEKRQSEEPEENQGITMS